MWNLIVSLRKEHRLSVHENKPMRGTCVFKKDKITEGKEICIKKSFIICTLILIAVIKIVLTTHGRLKLYSHTHC